jgi:hypothetical protein
MIETMLAERDAINRALAELGYTDDTTMTDAAIASESVTLRDFVAAPSMDRPKDETPEPVSDDTSEPVTSDDMPDIATAVRDYVPSDVPPVGTNMPQPVTPEPVTSEPAVMSNDEALTAWRYLDSDSRAVLATIVKRARRIPDIATVSGGTVSAATARRRIYGTDSNNPVRGSLIALGYVESAEPWKQSHVSYVATATGRALVEAGARQMAP